MNAKKMIKTDAKKRLIAIGALALIVAVILFSSFYIIQEADHDCSGMACPVCAAIQQCGQNLRQIAMCVIVIAVIMAMCCLFRRQIDLAHFGISTETPINRKVRLNN